jgi:hypothetical protein
LAVVSGTNPRADLAAAFEAASDFFADASPVCLLFGLWIRTLAEGTWNKGK